MATLLDIVQKDATSRSITLRIIDSTDGTPEQGVVFNTSGIAMWYRRQDGFRVSITLADLTTPDLEDTWETGGFLHIDDGECRLDVPDAAFATGANHVDIGGTVTGMVVIGGRVKLVGYNPEATAWALASEVTAARMGALTDWIEGGRLDLLIDLLTPAGPTKAEMDTAHGLLGTEAKQDTAQTDLDTLTGSDGATLATTQGNYAPSTVTALATAQTDLDTITGSDGVTLATAQGNYAPALASVLGALDDTTAAGDPTATDTAVQYLKQVVNLLAGSTGIGTMPSAADPANGVNLFEMLRAAMGATFATSTDSLEVAVAERATIQTAADAILTDTGTTIPALLPSALVNGRIDASIDGTGMETGARDALLQQQMTEVYNADGTAPTLEQALMGILQALTEFSISGTALTVKKLDGSTTAMTLTLSDATNPTSVTRAS